MLLETNAQRRTAAASDQEADTRHVGLALLTVDDAVRKLEQMERLNDDFVATAPMPPPPQRDPLR